MEKEKKEKKSSMEIDIPDDIEKDLAEEDQEPEKEEERSDSKEKEYYERLLYVTAEFDNFKKRVKKEKAEYVKFATERLIKEIIPVLDNFERALEKAKESEGNRSVVEGVELIFNQLKSVLKKEGIKSIDSVGKSFDPLIHEAISQVPTSDHEPNTVISEEIRAYFLNNKLIRPARVVVSAPLEDPSDKQEDETDVISQQETDNNNEQDEQ